MFQHFRCFAVCFTALLVAGCAHDVLLRTETKAFTETAGKSEAAGRSFYAGLIAEDRALWGILHRADRDCVPDMFGRAYFIASDEPHDLCSAVPRNTTQAAASGIDQDAFKVQYAALSFVKTYLKALAEVSADPELDARDSFASAAADLNVLVGALDKQAIPEARIGAVGDLEQMLRELSTNRKSAKAIRKIIATNRVDIDADFRRLIDWLKRDTSAARASNAATMAVLATLSTNDDAIGADARQWRIERQYADHDRNAALQRCLADAKDVVPPQPGLSERDLCKYPEAGVMLAGWRAHGELLGLIDGRPSKKQKAKLMKLQRENFMRVVKLYLDLIGVF